MCHALLSIHIELIIDIKKQYASGYVQNGESCGQYYLRLNQFVTKACTQNQLLFTFSEILCVQSYLSIHIIPLYIKEHEHCRVSSLCSDPNT